jgi:hypothetical protein
LVLPALEFLQENRVFAGQAVSQGKIIISCCFFGLSLALDGLLISLHIFGEEVLTADLIEISKVVDAFFRKESYFIEGLRDVLFLTPVYIPVIVFGLAVVASKHGFLDAVGEIGLEFDVVAG